MSSEYPQPPYRQPPIRNADQAVESFAGAGIDIRLDRIRDRSAFSIDFDLFPLGSAELVCTTWGTDSWMRAHFTDRIAVILNPNAALASVFTTEGDEVPASDGEAPILLPGRDIEVFRPMGSPLFVLSANVRDLERLLREVTGDERGHLDFASALNRWSPEGKRFERLIHFAAGELAAQPTAVENPIFRRQFDELVLGGMLLLPGRHHRLIDRSRTSHESALVRQAEEFMEANVHCPIGMSDVASECGCSRSILYQAFKRERQWTPLQFLVRRRMERARKLLSAPFTELNVTRVALDCGYANFSRFSEVYRRLYGETPSMTLDRSR